VVVSELAGGGCEAQVGLAEPVLEGGREGGEKGREGK